MLPTQTSNSKFDEHQQFSDITTTDSAVSLLGQPKQASAQMRLLPDNMPDNMRNNMYIEKLNLPATSRIAMQPAECSKQEIT